MKALSIRQPWAELIVQGRKTLELRTWQVSYRGPIAIHASQTASEEACRAFGLDPAGLVRGALVGTADLVEIVPLDEGNWAALRAQHLSRRDFPGSILGWRLERARRLPQPIPLSGRLGLFSVPDEVVAGKAPPPLPATLPGRDEILERDPEKPFELRVLRVAGGYALALYQWPVVANGEPFRAERLVALSGNPLRAVTDHVLEALRRAGYRATDLSRERRQPFRLDEETGVRLGLLFLAVKPLARSDRIEAISGALRAMPSEEAYYWFSKCTGAASMVQAQRALRILLAGE